MSKFSFLNFDSLGMIVGLRFQGQSRYKTRVGSFFTILILLVLLTTFVYFMDIYFKGSDFSEIYSTIKYWDSQNVTISDQFEIGFMIKVDGQIFTENEIWKLEAHYVEDNIKSKTRAITPLNISACQADKWNSVKYQFELLNMDNALCVNINNLTLRGNYNTEAFSYIELKYNFKIDMYNPKTVDNSKTYIESKKPSVSLFYTEGSFEVHGYSTVISYFINSINVNLTWMDTNNFDVYLSLDEMRKSNDKIFYSELNVDTYFAIEKYFEKNYIRSLTDPNSIYFKIMASSAKSVTTINYIPLTVIISRIGGVIQSCLIIIMYVNRLFSDWLYDLEHMNVMTEKLYNDNQNYQEAIYRTKRINEPNIENPNSHLHNETKVVTNKIKIKDCSESIEPSAISNPVIKEMKETLQLKDNTNIKYGSLNELNAKANKENSIKFIQDLAQIQSNSQSKRKLSSHYNSNEMREIIISIDGQSNLKFSLGSLLCFKYFIFLSKCCLSRRKKIVYDFSQAFLDRTFEVSNTHKSYLNIELLKYLLLNDRQLVLFENVSLTNMQTIIDKVQASTNRASTEIGVLASAVNSADDTEISRKLARLFLV